MENHPWRGLKGEIHPKPIPKLQASPGREDLSGGAERGLIPTHLAKDTQFPGTPPRSKALSLLGHSRVIPRMVWILPTNQGHSNLLPSILRDAGTPKFAGAAPPTSLKLSNADRMISWPPLTRQTAASSSRTRAFVLWRKQRGHSGPALIQVLPAWRNPGSWSWFGAPGVRVLHGVQR